MLQVQNLSKSYGTRSLFEGVSFTLDASCKCGFVGRNGSGKSTLFRLLLGEERPDSGEIIIPKNYSIGALEQHIRFSHSTVLEECATGLRPEEKDDTYKVEKILFGLGFGKDDLQRDPLSFSGGYQIRMNLAKVLLQNPDLLLLDEPTNYLDIVGLRWLSGFLRRYSASFLIITHDRDFMDSVTTHTMGIVRAQVKMLKGSSVKFYEQIKSEDAVYEQTRLNQEKKKKDLQDFITRFKAKASKAAQAQARMKALEKMDDLDKLSTEKDIGLKFSYQDCPAKNLLFVEDLGFHYPENLSTWPVRSLSFSLSKKDRICVIGKNGKGKSTLLKLLAGELTPLEGRMQMHPQTRIGHFGQTNIQRLDEESHVAQEIWSANSDLSMGQVRSICGAMMFEGEDALKMIKVLSGGERARVLLGQIIANPVNVLLLDEPTNHLDMYAIDRLSEEIESYPGAVVIVTHSEMMLRKLATKLIVFHRNKVEVFDGSYDEFLTKIGWEDEQAETGDLAAITKVPRLDYKEQKRLRSELIMERSRMVSPLQKMISGFETSIMEKEELLNAKEASFL